VQIADCEVRGYLRRLLEVYDEKVAEQKKEMKFVKCTVPNPASEPRRMAHL